MVRDVSAGSYRVKENPLERPSICANPQRIRVHPRLNEYELATDYADGTDVHGERHMKDLFVEIAECLKRNERIVLATIVSSSGSSPLPSGSMMLVKRGGDAIVGSVGGGLLEALVIEEAKKYFLGNMFSTIGKFDLNDDVSNEGMICGGSVDVLLEPLGQDELAVYQKLEQSRSEGDDTILLKVLDESQKMTSFTLTSKDDSYLESIRLQLKGEVGNFSDIVRRSFGQEDVRRIKVGRGEVVIQPIRGLQNLIVFGGGHVSKYLTRIATTAGFSTTVIDDRQEFADPERFPGASRVFASDFDKAFGRIEVKPSTYLVIVTRGHSSDAQVLEMAIRTPAKYVGMIGSKRKVIACFEELVQHGVPFADLKRVHAPIGLDIGAITAEEIAVSIVAELVRVRRGFQGASDAISEQLATWFDKKF